MPMCSPKKSAPLESARALAPYGPPQKKSPAPRNGDTERVKGAGLLEGYSKTARK